MTEDMGTIYFYLAVCLRTDNRRTIMPAALAAIDLYDGRTDAHCWLASFKELAQIYDWTVEDRLRTHI
jgi:hypothetical protein